MNQILHIIQFDELYEILDELNFNEKSMLRPIQIAHVFLSNAVRQLGQWCSVNLLISFCGF